MYALVSRSDRTTESQHPQLGRVMALDHGETIAYRGIKYAELQHAFAEPVLFAHPSLSKVLDATSYGPQCVQGSATCDAEFAFIQHELPRGEFKTSLTECLNLNITTPKGGREGLQPLPVFVFIHGGGFSLGGNAWPQYDPARLVELSIREGSPVIGININYRLGLPGFLASQGLIDAGARANNGLRDQRVALLWIRKYVGGFGGDPENVTVVGESAGSVAAFLHLESTQPLFKRILAMGGSPLLLKPLTMAAASGIHNVVMERLGFAQMQTADEKVRALKEASADQLVAAAEGLPMLPVVDGEYVKSESTFTQWSFQESALPGTQWCESVMIGDCEMDSSILFYMLHDRQARLEETFLACVNDSLHENPVAKQQLLEAYHIGSGSGNDAQNQAVATDNILHFAQDIGFYAPLVTIASGFPGKRFVFHFNEPNPWDGRYQGVASHLLDAAFLYQNFNEFLDEAQRGSAEAFGKHFVAYVAGREPFPQFAPGERGAMVYGAGGDDRQTFVRSRRCEDVGRRSTIFRLAQSSSLEELSALWGCFLSRVE
ncbi:uncharacterized protein L3040_004010 [Drepanopeziza brunnea f. sp. 'multigermtubi']|uniref:Carboxylic ester hydrolase n=1 Tax=Marssonina brunnea f. sp. multigermtubi (strain MB_m1) TaxID=1072389 RepID=K1XT94_MARBU|nr:uncharacterized protein MBM_06332 [Drepanopeziza brunnea f. sp. 'multigermtubi' MB_m1]EKD15704.1 hypothetical protein MBM_06332 [Drepanopeziza brunnea f. sp. 'multigermtubi' MB_m1]KAJ5046784.1 hypothetical protein L3040_004010 [Drepanopeziza brunnea f. sp. 'multigermtubi']